MMSAKLRQSLEREKNANEPPTYLERVREVYVKLTFSIPIIVTSEEDRADDVYDEHKEQAEKVGKAQGKLLQLMLADLAPYMRAGSFLDNIEFDSAEAEIDPPAS